MHNNADPMRRMAMRAMLTAACAFAGAIGHAEAPSWPPGVVALVNGQPIERALLDELAKARQAGNDSVTMPDRARLLDDLINMEVMTQRAHSTGLATRPKSKAELALADKSLLGQRLLQRLAAETKVPDAELRARYQSLETELLLTTSHILLADERSAQALIERLDQGEAFAALARQYSLDTASKDQGGSLGPLNSADLSKPFAQAASSLKVGGFTRRAVRTEHGWHIIQLHALKQLRRPTYDSMRESLKAQVVNERVEAQIAQWRKDARLTMLQAP